MAKDKVTLNINVDKGEEKMKLTKVASAPSHKMFEAEGIGFGGKTKYRGQIIHDGKRIISTINIGASSEVIIIKDAPGMTMKESVTHIQNSINGSVIGGKKYIVRYDFLNNKLIVHYDSDGRIDSIGEIKINELRKRDIEENEKYNYSRAGEIHELDFLNMMVLETIAEHIMISLEMYRIIATERRMEEFNKQFEGVKNTVEVAQKEAAKEMKDKISESLKKVADDKTVVEKEEFDVNKKACVFFKNGTTKIACGVDDMSSLRKAFSVPDAFVKVGNLLVARDMVQMVELKTD